MYEDKIRWIRLGKRYWLKARSDNDGHTLVSPPEYKLREIQEWCKANNCGKRMSFFSEFRFKNEKEMSLFLLRWS